MSTAVASLPPIVERHISPPQQQQQFTSIATAAANHTSEREPVAKRARSNASSPAASPRHPSLVERSNSNGKASPISGPNGTPPVIKVKKEPASPSMSSRPRPKRLDLSSSTSNNNNNRGPQTGQQTSRPSAPLTSRDSAGLAIQDVGLACLSPGFQTNDPGMREQLQRSLDVRDQQRQIIEARQKGTKPGSAHETDGAQQAQDTTLFGVQTRTPSTSKRKGPPPGLSIAAPSASQFANDRVIQSAPLNQTFTGLRPGDQAYTRHAQHGPSALGQTSHIHHVPATQTNNRLPPIADVFANDRLDVRQGYPNNNSPSQNNGGLPPAPSPGFATQQQQQQQQQGPALSSRPREFRSAEEAMAGLSGGRDDLMPKVVHYGGVQPPTPPSPMQPTGGQHYPPQYAYSTAATAAGAGAGAPQQSGGYSDNGGRHPRPEILARTSSMNGRRRGREEYERDNGSPPRSFQQRAAEAKRAAVLDAQAVREDDDLEEAGEADWRRGMSGREKKEEFLRLCERAWDLFHS